MNESDFLIKDRKKSLNNLVFSDKSDTFALAIQK
jgi:hypothetical protein